MLRDLNKTEKYVTQNSNELKIIGMCGTIRCKQYKKTTDVKVDLLGLQEMEEIE